MNGFPIVFYRRSGSLRSPVKDYLDQVPSEERAELLHMIGALTQRERTFLSRYTKHVSGKIWELRVRLGNRQHRILYALREHVVVLLHAFLKKTRKTSRRDLECALANFTDYVIQTP